MSLENNFLSSFFVILHHEVQSFFFSTHITFSSNVPTYVPSHGVPLNWKQKQKVKTRMSRGTSVCNSRDQSCLPRNHIRGSRPVHNPRGKMKKAQSIIERIVDGEFANSANGRLACITRGNLKYRLKAKRRVIRVFNDFRDFELFVTTFRVDNNEISTRIALHLIWNLIEIIKFVFKRNYLYYRNIVFFPSLSFSLHLYLFLGFTR